MSSRRVQGRCPACGFESLFLGAGGYVTCSRVECHSPSAASHMLAHTPRLLVGAVLPDDDTLKQPAGYASRRDQLVALPGDPVTITRTCIDPEEYAGIFNAGYDEAVAQGLADDPSLAQDWLDQKLDAVATALRDHLVREDTVLAGARGDCSLADPCTTCIASTRRILAAVRVHLTGRKL